MEETGSEMVVFLADVTGSTPLYETMGDAKAAHLIGCCLDRMREEIAATGGAFVSAKGDDVLATFADAETALSTAEKIMTRTPLNGLSVHAGLHYGQVVSQRGDIFGDAVNVTARLAAMANPGEILISQDFAMRLPTSRSASLRRLNALSCKGKSEPIEVFSLNDDTLLRTEFMLRPGRDLTDDAPTADGLCIVLSVDGERRLVAEGGSLSLGRAPQNDLVVTKPWVSRHHATLSVTRGRVQLTDRSSYGSYVLTEGGFQFVALRETVVVTGAGKISLGTRAETPDAAVIDYEIRAT